MSKYFIGLFMSSGFHCFDHEVSRSLLYDRNCKFDCAAVLMVLGSVFKSMANFCMDVIGYFAILALSDSRDEVSHFLYMPQLPHFF